jgi:hypothetical protein
MNVTEAVEVLRSYLEGQEKDCWPEAVETAIEALSTARVEIHADEPQNLQITAPKWIQIVTGQLDELRPMSVEQKKDKKWTKKR